MEQYKQWLEEEKKKLGLVALMGKLNAECIENRINQIEGSLKLINEFENE